MLLTSLVITSCVDARSDDADVTTTSATSIPSETSATATTSVDPNTSLTARPADPQLGTTAGGTEPAPTTAATVTPTANASNLVGLSVIELQPEDPMPGGQFVVFINHSQGAISLQCWALHSEATGTTLYIPSSLELSPGSALRVTPSTAWLGITDRVELLGPDGQVVDASPQLSDEAIDDRVWYRDAAGEWQFGRRDFPSGMIDGFATPSRPSGC